MRQLVYISTATRGVEVDTDQILAISRRNNARGRVTGALWFDGRRFLQALEGEESVVDATFRRIQADERHKALVILSSRIVPVREFGEWAMALGGDGAGAGAGGVERIAALSAGASAEVRATFESFARIRRAA